MADETPSPIDTDIAQARIGGLYLTRRRALALGALAGGVALGSRRAAAVLQLDVTPGNFQPMPIAVADFLGGAPTDNEAALGVSQIITNNLRRSGLFAPIDPAAFLEKIASVDTVPRFPTGARSTRRRWPPAALPARATAG